MALSDERAEELLTLLRKITQEIIADQEANASSFDPYAKQADIVSNGLDRTPHGAKAMVARIVADPITYLDGGLDEAEEETPGFLSLLIHTLNRMIATGEANENHVIFRDHARYTQEEMARINREDNNND